MEHTITLKDGTKKEYASKTTPLEIAESISKKLAKEAVAAKVNGQLWDLTRILPKECTLEIITRNDAEGLEIIRHDAAHVLAEAIKELYPHAQITIGPSIENGFYYDIFIETPFSTDDLIKIENKMKEIINRDDAFIREEWERNKAIEFFKSIGEYFKAEIIESIPETEMITLYRQGQFIDLCRGPHLPSTGKIGTAFKLMKVAGAYWRGDSRNPMLQRIYGTAWATQAQLDQYLHFLEEAEKRDHRRLGHELKMFHIQEEAVGSIFWHPKGWKVYRKIENFIREHLEREDYVEVKTPQLVDRSLWEASGHWDMYGQNMFTLQAEERTLAVKPMNCPCHVQIYKQGIKSYRDLPLRMSEFGSCHRNEPSGALHGLMRVRAFTQDDAHIFCTPEQISSETQKFCKLLLEIYKQFGFDEVKVKFSDRPEKRGGSDEMWDQAEDALRSASLEAGLELIHNPGEGAFYGPKLEFTLKDCLNREWQCGTLQVDFLLPERLDAHYIGEDGKKHRPVMLHRAILGSLERFMGVLIEHYAGKLPFWLSPTQVMVANITSDSESYAAHIQQELIKLGIDAELDVRNEKISYKVREHSLQKIPFIVVVGQQEKDNNTVTVRTLGSTQTQTLNLNDFLTKLQELENKRILNYH